MIAVPQGSDRSDNTDRPVELGVEKAVYGGAARSPWYISATVVGYSARTLSGRAHDLTAPALTGSSASVRARPFPSWPIPPTQGAGPWLSAGVTGPPGGPGHRSSAAPPA